MESTLPMTKNRFQRYDVSAHECESRPGKSDFATLEIVSQVRFTETVPEGRVELTPAYTLALQIILHLLIPTLSICHLEVTCLSRSRLYGRSPVLT
jgi:hypothetical protein